MQTPEVKIKADPTVGRKVDEHGGSAGISPPTIPAQIEKGPGESGTVTAQVSSVGSISASLDFDLHIAYT